MGRHSVHQGHLVHTAVTRAFPHRHDLVFRALEAFRDRAEPPAPTYRPFRAGEAGSPQLTSPQGWPHLPIPSAAAGGLLMRAIDRLTAGIGDSGDIDEESAQFLLSIGRDLRKYGLEAEHYPALAEAITGAFAAIVPDGDTPSVTAPGGQGNGGTDGRAVLPSPALPGGTAGHRVSPTAALCDAVELWCHVMATGAAEDAEADLPATVSATVVEVEHRCTDVVVVRVQMTPLRPWWPGQFVEVNTPYTEQHWRYLSPAVPFNPDGLAEFHIRGVGRFSQAVVDEARVGDVWTVGQAYGDMEVPHERDTIMIAGSTGLAGLRAMILDTSLRADKPRLHVFFGAKFGSELYELPTLKGFERAWPWLRVTPVVEWGLAEDGFASGLVAASDTEGAMGGKVADAAVEWLRENPEWHEASVMISGSPQMIEYSAAQCLAAGIPRERIQFDVH